MQQECEETTMSFNFYNGRRSGERVSYGRRPFLSTIKYLSAIVKMTSASNLAEWLPLLKVFFYLEHQKSFTTKTKTFFKKIIGANNPIVVSFNLFSKYWLSHNCGKWQDFLKIQMGWQGQKVWGQGWQLVCLVHTPPYAMACLAKGAMNTPEQEEF